jgi:hypothetical protein
MTLRLNGATSGYTEIDAPAAAGNNTLLLPSGNGSDGQILGTDGAGNLSWVGGRMVLETAQATTSGTSIDFTGIPSWVKKITVMFDAISVNAANATNVFIQIGDSGGIEATGYTASAFGTVVASSNASGGTSTIGYLLNYASLDSATNAYYGSVILTNLSGNTWVASGTFNSASQGSYLAGSKTLSDVLDRVRIVTNGTNTFDAGTINLLLEG